MFILAHHCFSIYTVIYTSFVLMDHTFYIKNAIVIKPLFIPLTHDIRHMAIREFMSPLCTFCSFFLSICSFIYPYKSNLFFCFPSFRCCLFYFFKLFQTGIFNLQVIKLANNSTYNNTATFQLFLCK